MHLVQVWSTFIAWRNVNQACLKAVLYIYIIKFYKIVALSFRLKASTDSVFLVLAIVLLAAATMLL